MPTSPVENTPVQAEPGKPRRTQAERSEAMRELLIDATLKCLLTDGYAGLTIGRIVEEAQVSRGAPLHHFASKTALFEAAAEALVNRLSYKVSAAYRQSLGADNPLETLMLHVWRDIYVAPEGAMLGELLNASRHEPELAVIVQRLWTRSYRITRRVAVRYLQTRTPTHPDIPPPDSSAIAERHPQAAQIVVLTQWLMRGLSQDIHLGAPPQLFEQYLKLWLQMVELSLAGDGKQT